MPRPRTNKDRRNSIGKLILSFVAVVTVLLTIGMPTNLLAAANGSLSGTVKDSTGAVISGATVTLVNSALRSQFTAITNAAGFYSLPALPVGHYDLILEAAGQ